MNIEDLRRWLPEHIARSGMTPTAISRAAGTGTGLIRDILEGKSNRPRYESLFKIAGVLGMKVEQLYLPPGESPKQLILPSWPNPPPGSGPIVAGPLPYATPDLPVLGEARTGYKGLFMNNGEPLAYVPRPPNLIGARGAFAVYVRGDSMFPRYLDGELVHVNPARPVTRNCFVLIELTNQEAFVKQFLKRDDQFVSVQQYNPQSTIKFKNSQISHVYRIVGSAEDS